MIERRNLRAVVILLIAGLFVFEIECISQNSQSHSELILQSELKQQQLRSNTQRVNEQLRLIIEEFERNGISGEDVQVLKSVQSVLNELGDKEMARIVDLLQQARSITDYTASQTRMLEAFSTQKSIIVKLKQLLDEFKRQQALYELSIMFNRIAEKQNANMKEAIAMEPLLQGRAFDKLTEAQKIPLQVQTTDQDFIKEETIFGLSKLDALLKEPTAGASDNAKRATEIVTNSNLKVILQEVIEDLKVARLYSAIGNEKKIRDTLREIASALIPAADATEAIQRALRELENLISEQKAIVKQTEELKQNNKTQDNNKEIAARQLDLSDRTDWLKEQIKNNAPQAASNLKESINKMQEAHSVLNSNEGRWRAKDAIAKENESLKNLELAKDNLQRASVISETRQPRDNIAMLKDLLGKVENLIGDETNLSKSANELEKARQISKLSSESAKRQDELKQQTRNVQTDAAPLSPQAAEELGIAAEQMQKSQTALSKGKNEPASQMAAVDALKKAANELERTLNDMEKKGSELAAAEEALKQLSDVIKKQQGINKETATFGAKNQNPPDDVLKPLAQKQARAANDTREIKVSPIAPEATQPIQSAISEMNQAQAQIAQAKLKEAQMPQANALDNLYKAKNAIQNKANGLKQELGIPDQSPSDLAEAAEQIENAQKQIDDALSNLAPAGLIDQLAKRQQEVAKNLARHSEKTARKNPIEQASQTASQAVKHLAQADLKNAISTMKQTEDAIQNAIQPQSNQSNTSANERNNSEDTGRSKPNNGQNGSQGQSNPQQQAVEAQKNQSNESKTAEAPSLNELKEEQNEIRQIAQQLMDTMKTPINETMARAMQNLNSASAVIGNLAATTTGLPQKAESALQKADGSLMNANAQAMANNAVPAQKSATAAQSELAQASAAIAVAKAAMGKQTTTSNQQGNTAAQNKNGQPGQGQEGDGKAMAQSEQRAAGTTGKSQGDSGNWYGTGGDKGKRVNSEGSSRFIGLPKRDRDAIVESQSEKYPQDYASFIEQYMKNLSDEATARR